MTDGVVLNAGSGGVTAATDDCGAAGHAQVVKLAISTDGSATLIPADATNGLQVNLTKAIPGTGATNLGKAEDDAASSGDVGVAALTVRQDTPAGSTSADGDYQTQKTDSVGRLWVNASGAPVPVTDNGGNLSIDDGGNSITVDGTVAVSGTVAVTDNSGSLTVDNAGTFATQENGAALTSLQLIDNLVLAEDAAAVSGDPGVQILAVRASSPANTSSTNGDYEPLQVNGGRLWCSATIDAALPAGSNVIGALSANQSVNVAQIAGTTTATGNGTASAGCQRVTIASDNTAFSVNSTDTGAAAHDAAISGNPVRIAGRALTSDYTAVSAGDTADLITTLLGKLVTIPYANPANTWNYAAAAGGLVSTTGVTAKAAAGAGVRNYVTKVSIVNSHATISTEVVIRDGAAGTVLWRGWAQAAGGGQVEKFDPPLRGTANTLIEIAEITATATTGVLVNLQGFTAAE